MMVFMYLCSATTGLCTIGSAKTGHWLKQKALSSAPLISAIAVGFFSARIAAASSSCEPGRLVPVGRYLSGEEVPLSGL